jgi:hypothetical protein
MEEYFAKQDKPYEAKEGRPPVLTILCLFSMIGGAWSVFSNLFTTIFYDTIKMGAAHKSKLDEVFQGSGDFTELIRKAVEMISALPREYFLINIFLSAASFYGALEMWRLKKIGFHFYTGAQIGMLIVSMIFVGISFTSSSTYVSIAFIALYAMNLKFMGSQSVEKRYDRY